MFRTDFVVKKIRRYSNLPICLDTEGAQIRTSFKGRKFLKINQIIKINKAYSEKNFNLYPEIFNKLKKNQILEIGFENLIIKISSVKRNYSVAKVISPGFLENNKGVHIQNQKIHLSPLTKKDLQSIKIAKEIGIEKYALSFTNNVNVRGGGCIIKPRHRPSLWLGPRPGLRLEITQ